MSRQQLPPQIKKITYATGTIRYQVIVDIGTVNGKRKQFRHNYPSEQAARKKLAEIQAQVQGGSYIHKSGTTVSEVVEQWLSGRTGLRSSTLSGHRHRLKPLVALYGDLPIQELEKHHIDTLMARLKVGDIPRPKNMPRKPSNGQSRRNILGSIKQLLKNEVRQGHLPRNVAEFVDTPILDSDEKPTYTKEQVQAILDVTANDRDAHLQALSFTSPRKAELAGLLWEHIDMDAHTLKICQTRTVVDGHPVLGKPKTERSNRVLDIPDFVYTTLLHARAVQARETLAAGDRYEDSGYVFVDELGRAVHPDQLTDRCNDACKRAGVPEYGLHVRRHTFATLQLLNGESHVVVGDQMGHSNSSITLRVYGHVQTQARKDAMQSFQRLVTNRDKPKAG